MHDNQLTHTDLKPENILFCNSEYDCIYNQRKVCFMKFIIKSNLSFYLKKKKKKKTKKKNNY